MAKGSSPAKARIVLTKRKDVLEKAKHTSGGVRSNKRAPVPPGTGKIRIGIIYGKVFDPVKVGTQDKDYPEEMKVKNNTGPNAQGWGGQFHADVSTGLKIARLHPDIFEIDFMRMSEVTEKRCLKNHLNFNFWGDYSIAVMEGKMDVARRIEKIQKNPDFRHYPSWNYYEWIIHKSRYMKQCIAAGIPMIDTIFVDKGFDARKVMKQIVAKGWDKFFVKPAYLGFFGAGALNGKTKDFLNDMTPLLEYEKENKSQKEFLIQPYVLKPNGLVFDEIRNFFVDGQWQYSVYTDGTDYEGFWEQPAGALKDACRRLAERTYEQVRKVAKWDGVRVDTLLNRIDIGVVPDKSRKEGWRIFVNEIEPQMTTWLGRYCPHEIADLMGRACVQQARKLLRISLSKNRKIPNKARVEQLLDVLDLRLGPMTHA